MLGLVIYVIGVFQNPQNVFCSYALIASAQEEATDCEAMGRVRTKTVKRTARIIVEKYYGKLTLDFQVPSMTSLCTYSRTQP